MTEFISDDEFCECGLPGALENVVFMHSCDQEGDGFISMAKWRCGAGHWWNGELTEAVPVE